MSTIFWKSLCRLFDKYAVARTEHDALVKSRTKIFSNFVAFSENPNFSYNFGQPKDVKIHILTIYEQMDLEMAIIFCKNGYLRDFYTYNNFVCILDDTKLKSNIYLTKFKLSLWCTERCKSIQFKFQITPIQKCQKVMCTRLQRLVNLWTFYVTFAFLHCFCVVPSVPKIILVSYKEKKAGCRV